MAMMRTDAQPIIAPQSIVPHEGSRLHFESSHRLSSSEEFKPCRRSILCGESEESVGRRAKRLVTSSNSQLSTQPPLIRLRQPRPASLEVTAQPSLLPCAKWKTKRVVLDEHGVTLRVQRSQEMDLTTLMNRKQRIEHEAPSSSSSQGGRQREADASAGYFKEGGLISGSTMILRRNQMVRTEVVEENAARAVLLKRLKEEESLRRRVAQQDAALVLRLTVGAPI